MQITNNQLEVSEKQQEQHRHQAAAQISSHLLGTHGEEDNGEHATIPVPTGFSHSRRADRECQDPFPTRLSVRSAGVEEQEKVTWRNGDPDMKQRAYCKTIYGAEWMEWNGLIT